MIPVYPTLISLDEGIERGSLMYIEAVTFLYFCIHVRIEQGIHKLVIKNTVT